MQNPDESQSPDTSEDNKTARKAESVEGIRAESHFGLRRGDQVVVAVLLCIVLLLSLGYWAKLSGWGRRPVEIERLEARRYDFRLDVNDSTWVEWAQLEGVGEVLARRIIADRRARGPFASVDDVQRVNGIGEKKLAVLREWLYVGEQEPADKNGEAIQ